MELRERDGRWRRRAGGVSKRRCEMEVGVDGQRSGGGAVQNPTRKKLREKWERV